MHWLALDMDLKVVSHTGFFRIHGDHRGPMVAMERLLAEATLPKSRKERTTSAHGRTGVMFLLALMVRTLVSALVGQIFRAVKPTDGTETCVRMGGMEQVCLLIVPPLAAHAQAEQVMRQPGEKERAPAPAPAQVQPQPQ